MEAKKWKVCSPTHTRTHAHTQSDGPLTVATQLVSSQLINYKAGGRTWLLCVETEEMVGAWGWYSTPQSLPQLLAVSLLHSEKSETLLFINNPLVFI
jgi:hypothetical protein